MVVSPEKQIQLQQHMEELGILEEDIVEKFILGSGKGGQKVNKTSSCVYIKHLPSGIEIKCQQQRSRELNRLLARRELCDRIEQLQLGKASAKMAAISKLRRQKARRSRKTQQKILENKAHHSAKKRGRQSPDQD